MHIKTLILNSTPINNNLISMLLDQYKEKNILIINYTVDEIDRIQLEEVLELQGFKSFEIFNPQTRNIDGIEEKITSLTDKDFVLFLGLEQLFIGTANNAFIVRTNKKTFNYKSYENIDFDKVMNFIDYFYKQGAINLICMVTTVDLDINEKVINELEEFDIEVMSLKYKDMGQENFKNIQEEILEVITNKSYQEAINTLEKYKDRIDKSSFLQAKVVIYMQHGFKDQIIEFLSKEYDSLKNNEKIKLADLYFDKGEYTQAFTITKSIFKENPLTIDCPFLLLKIAIELNQFDKWYKKILIVDKEDIKVLELSADYFTKIKKFKEAINLRKKIFSLTKNPSHLLLVEILKVEDEKPEKGYILEENIKRLVKSFNNVDLEIEASYNLGRIWFEVYNSPYKAYYHFKNVLKKCNNIHSVESAKYRMKLLSNQGHADKIIKQAYQKKYPDKLPTLRVNELLNSIPILTYDDIGYIKWQSYIDDSQTMDIWRIYLIERTINELKKIDTSLINSYIEKSSLFNELTKSDIVQMIRAYNHEKFSIDNIDLKDIAETALSQTHNMKEQIWARYYLVINFIHIGESQLANNNAISLWHLANNIQDNELSKLSRHLGTLAWGIAQFKNAKEIEGIASILVTLKYFLETKEVVPIMEDALGILNIWIQMNKKIISKENFNSFMLFFNELSKNHKVESEVSDYLANEDWESIYNKLGYQIYNSKEYSSQWGIDFYYYILAAQRLEKLDISLIVNNVNNLIYSLQTRADIRAKVLYSISETLFTFNSEEYIAKERYKICLNLLVVSIQDIEKQRSKFTNTYERSFLSDNHRVIYKLYLVINIILFRTKSYNTNEEHQLINNIINTFDYLSPRVLKEKKDDNVNKKELTKEIKNIEKEYLSLIDSLSQYGLKNFNDAYVTEDYKQKSTRYGELRTILETKHPTYKKDSNFEHEPIQLIQKHLENDEIYYQYVDSKYFVCYLLLTQDFIDIGFIDNLALDKDIEELASDLQNFQKATAYDINEINNSYYKVSQKYFKPLLNLYKNYKKVYLNSDLTIPLLSSNLIRLEESWLIEEVDFIVNVTNKNYFIDRKNIENFNFKIATLGKKSDKQMRETELWINQDDFKKSIFINEFEKNINTMDNILDESKFNSFLLVSHGIQGNANSNLTGALSIDGEQKSYTIDDLSFVEKLDCIFFLTCSSGSFSIGEHETSNSIINNLLSKDINSAILCKWDVFLDPSLEISENIIKLSKNSTIEHALNKSLKNILKNRKWEHPVYWAGIEIWKN